MYIDCDNDHYQLNIEVDKKKTKIDGTPGKKKYL